MRNVFGVLLLIGAVFSGTACSSTPPAPPTPTVEAVYQTMTIDAFAAALVQPEAYTVVNVHIPYAGEVPNTDLQIAYDDIDMLTAALPDRDAPIILYCRSGRMSEEASQALIELGYTNLWDVPGGMNAWAASGRELLMSGNGS